jgi:hypothetical protein
VIRCVTFASCYVYSPFGSSRESERSRLLRSLLKAGDARFIFKYAGRVRQQVGETSPIAGFFCPGSVLVPVPGCRAHAVAVGSVAEHLAAALLNEGLGHSVWPGLHRIRTVRKSATAPPGSRPTVGNHYDSFLIDAASAIPQQVVLIDDVVTKGRTLLAAASRVQESFPQARIRAFALVRTMGFITEVDRVLDPCMGQIRWQSGDALRSP